MIYGKISRVRTTQLLYTTDVVAVTFIRLFCSISTNNIISLSMGYIEYYTPQTGSDHLRHHHSGRGSVKYECI